LVGPPYFKNTRGLKAVIYINEQDLYVAAAHLTKKNSPVTAIVTYFFT
jgi:hypothetical protein